MDPEVFKNLSKLEQIKFLRNCYAELKNSGNNYMVEHPITGKFIFLIDDDFEDLLKELEESIH